MSCSITDHEASSQSLFLLSHLEDAFQCKLDIYRRSSNMWQPIGSRAISETRPLPSLSFELNSWLEELASQLPPGPQWRPLDGQRAMMAVCSVGDDGLPEIIAGSVVLDAMQLARSASTLAVRCAEASGTNDLLNQYASRLSSSFEELTFLRRLTKHVELCVAKKSLAEITQAVLPNLRELIGVESLCLISAQSESDSGRFVADTIAGVVGELPCSFQFWRDMVDGLQHRNRQVIVRNFESQVPLSNPARCSPLKSLVLAPVQKDDQVFGWLLAVNKARDPQSENNPPHSLGSDELGSIEASLLEAAALILGSHAANNQMFRELELLVVEVIHTLVRAVEAKDTYTSGHSHRVALIARLVAERLQLSESMCEDVYSAGLLHDIGKIGVVDDVLLKEGKLSPEEYEQIKQHPVIGAKLLQRLQPLAKLVPGVLYHHEAIDGTGYPHGLVGDEIPLIARILAVADAWDAMTSDRPYRAGMSIERASEILREGAGRQWDSRAVEVLLNSRADVTEVCKWWRSCTSQPGGLIES